ncbi:hypothetical protein [Bacillus benzoevorans]|nr:hypothetical protein [Bacillus benzoevorans]
MGAYIVDFILVAGLIIGITAINGVLVNGFGEKFIGRKHKSEYVDKSAQIQSGWKQVGGGHKGN